MTETEALAEKIFERLHGAGDIGRADRRFAAQQAFAAAEAFIAVREEWRAAQPPVTGDAP